MRVVVDATAAVRQRAGVGRFARGILAGLAQCDAHNDYYLITTGTPRINIEASALPRKSHWLHSHVPERLARIVWQRLRMAPPPTLIVPGAKLFFTPDFALPVLWRCPAILTVHDLSFLTHPECADDGLRKYLAREVPRSIAAATAVVAVSHTTAHAIEALLGVSPSKISIIGNGVDQRFKPLDRSDGDNSPPFGLKNGYILAVGTLEPRKNYVRLLQAIKILKKSRRLASQRGKLDRPECQLVIAGREGWLFEPIFREVARLGLSRDVRFLTNTTDADLVSLYQHAGVLVCPSLYEGFGIPPLEALACGVPVASSTGGSLPEILAGGALYFDPIDVEGMADAIDRVLHDEALRARILMNGAERVAHYTWQRSAQRAAKLFERVAA